MKEDGFKTAYKSEDIAGLYNVDAFDKLRVKTWEASMDRAEKEKDPANKYQMKAKIFGEIKQSAGYFLGDGKLGAALAGLGLDNEAELNASMAVGSTLIDKLLED